MADSAAHHKPTDRGSILVQNESRGTASHSPSRTAFFMRRSLSGSPPDPELELELEENMLSLLDELLLLDAGKAARTTSKHAIRTRPRRNSHNWSARTSISDVFHRAISCE